MDCKGPCLLHCYYKISILLLLIGVIIGLCIPHVYYFYYPNKNENKYGHFKYETG